MQVSEHTAVEKQQGELTAAKAALATAIADARDLEHKVDTDTYASPGACELLMKHHAFEQYAAAVATYFRVVVLQHMGNT